MLSAGEVAEWSNVPDSKSGVVATSPWVRIPPSPPICQVNRGPTGPLFIFPHRFHHIDLDILKMSLKLRACGLPQRWLIS